MIVERAELSVRYKAAGIIHENQKQQTHTLFQKHCKPLPPPGNLAASARKLSAATEAWKNHQQVYWLSAKKTKATNLTGILTTTAHRCNVGKQSRHNLLDLYIAFVLLLELERARLTADCAMKMDQLREVHRIYNQQSLKTKRLFKRHNQPLPDHMNSNAPAQPSASPPNTPPTVPDSYHDVVNALERKSNVATEAIRAKRAEREALSNNDIVKAAKHAMSALLQRRKNPSLTGHLPTCCRRSLTDYSALCSSGN